MELRHVRYFLAVAEELHFGRAAARLRISQPPLSAQIRDLEEEVGARLFDRTRRRVALTGAGQSFLGRARDLLARADAMKREAASIAQGELGTLTVGYSSVAIYRVLPPLLVAFQSRHPTVTLQLAEMPGPAQGAALREGRIDVGFACLPAPVEGLRVAVVSQDTMVVALPAKHRLARRPRLRLGDLADQPMIGLRASAEPGWANTFAAALAGAGMTPRYVQDADTKLAMLGLVAAQAGLALVASSMANLRRPGVVFRPVAGVKVRFPLGLVTLPEPTPLAARFLAMAQPGR